MEEPFGDLILRKQIANFQLMVAGLFGDSKKTKRLTLDDFLLSFKQVKEKTQEELDKIGARTALWFHRIFGGELNPVVYEILGEEADEDKAA